MCHRPEHEQLKVVAAEARMFITSAFLCIHVGPSPSSPTWASAVACVLLLATPSWSSFPVAATRGRLRAPQSGPAPHLPTMLQDSKAFQVRALVLPAACKALHDLPCPLPAFPSFLPLSLSVTVLPPHSPPLCSSHTPCAILLQDLGTGCFLLIGTPFFYMPPWLPLTHHSCLSSNVTSSEMPSLAIPAKVASSHPSLFSIPPCFISAYHVSLFEMIILFSCIFCLPPASN